MASTTILHVRVSHEDLLLYTYMPAAIPFDLANQATASQVQAALATGDSGAEPAAPIPVSPTEVAPSPAEDTHKSDGNLQASDVECHKDYIENKMNVQSCIIIHFGVISV